MNLRYALYVEQNSNGFVDYSKKYLSVNTVDDDQPQQFVWKDHGDSIDESILTFESPSESIEWLNSNFYERTNGQIKLETLIRKFG